MRRHRAVPLVVSPTAPRRTARCAAGARSAVGGLAALLVGTLGPLPNMYKPVWFTDKQNVAIAEVVAAHAAGLLLRSRIPRL
ncbi:hypothetical protein ACQ4WX_38015 [Streptomyces lasalocidi]